MQSSIYTEVMNELSSKSYDPGDLTLDGILRRFDRDGRRNAWIVGHQGATRSGRDFATVFFGDWKTNQSYKYSTNQGFTKEEQKDVRRFEIRKKSELDEELRQLREKATQRAKDIFRNSKKQGEHEYLKRKGLSDLFSARIYFGPESRQGPELVIPMRDFNGNLKGLQRIFEGGDKLFLKGQQTSELFCTIPEVVDFSTNQKIYVTEGFATGASIHLATGASVVCVLSASNLPSVCWKLKQLNPRIDLIIAGDDDQWSAGNVGRAKAIEAASLVGASYVFPKFVNLETKPTDFNDLHLASGLAEVKAQLGQAEESKTQMPALTTIAQQFLKEFEMTSAEKRLVAWRGAFFQFDGKKYIKVSRSDMQNDVIKFMQRHPIAWSIAGKNKGTEVLANIEAHCNLKSFRSIPFWIEDEEEDVGDIVALDSCTVDLTNAADKNEVKQFPHTSNLFQTSCLPYDFKPTEKCPTWMNFLEEMIPDENTRLSVQEWFGLNLVFDNTFQKFAIFHGPGANGKTVCCVVLRCLLGERNVSAVPLEAFDPKRTFMLAGTVGKLANIVEELNVGSKTSEGELKKYVAGGILTVENKRENPFETIPSARLTFATNTLPEFNDSSDGLWRRVLLYPMKKQVLDPKLQRRELADPKFWRQSGELPGIFNWAMEGLLRLRKSKKFTVSTEMAEALGDYQIDSNPARIFLKDHCQLRDGAIQSSGALFAAYKDYATACGFKPVAANVFAKEVRLTFPGLKRSNGPLTHEGTRSRLWYGLELISSLHGLHR